MKKLVIKPGDIFNSWTAIRRDHCPGRTSQNWLFRCACGFEKNMSAHDAVRGKSKSCVPCSRKKFGLERRGENHPLWKGGKIQDSDGYVLLHGHHEHPNSQKSGYVYEHIFVMTEFLGRSLFEHENVHHKNGMKDDNHIDNLELWSTSQPSGQRVEDKLSWASDLLTQYGAKVTWDG